jgi:hypothetical protein
MRKKKIKIPRFKKKMPSPFKDPEGWDRYMDEFIEWSCDCLAIAAAARRERENTEDVKKED